MDDQIFQTKSMFFFLIIPLPHLNEGFSSSRPYFSAVISLRDITACIRWYIMLFSSVSIGFFASPSQICQLLDQLIKGLLREKHFYYREGMGIHLNSLSSCSIQHLLLSLPTSHRQGDDKGPTDQSMAIRAICRNNNQAALIPGLPLSSGTRKGGHTEPSSPGSPRGPTAGHTVGPTAGPCTRLSPRTEQAAMKHKQQSQLLWARQERHLSSQ